MYRTVVCLSCPVCPVCDVGVWWPNCWMDQDATWYGGRPRPRRHCVRWDPAPKKGHSSSPTFRPCGQTVAHLNNCWAPCYYYYY